MSIAARAALVRSEYTVFRSNSQRDDLMNPSVTQTELIAFLSDLIQKRHYLLFTAIRSDHHDDGYLGLHSHANGYAADVWFLKSSKPDDYLDPGDPEFEAGLHDAAASPWMYQIGLAGSALTANNRSASGERMFVDDGGDHIHLGAE